MSISAGERRNAEGTFHEHTSAPGLREHPERPGETMSEYCDGASRVGDEDELTCDSEEENIVLSRTRGPCTDKFGFFLDKPTEIEPPLNLSQLRRRERKWLHMFENWKHYMDDDFEKVRSRCCKGVPPSVRAHAWKYLSGAAYQMDSSLHNKHVFAYCSRQPGDPKYLDEIERDLNRQFPEHEMFSSSGRFAQSGKEDLMTLLKSWTILHPEEGYCQGQAPVASVLLMNMPLRDAFYCFVQICHKYLPGYYSPGLEALQVDGDILIQLLKEKSRTTYRHLKKHKVEPALFMIEWFMCIFCRSLPWSCVLRVWDMFFCQGVKVLFKVAIVLFRLALSTTKHLSECNDLHSIVIRLRKIGAFITCEETFIKKVVELDLDDGEIERLNFRALKLRQMRAL